MKYKLFSFLSIFQFAFTSCQSQQKNNEISFDSKIPQIYYYPVGEVRGTIKEIIDISENSLKKDDIDTSRYVFDNKKHTIFSYSKSKLFTYFRQYCILDKLKYRRGF